jgi:hypothetical protein
VGNFAFLRSVIGWSFIGYRLPVFGIHRRRAVIARRFFAMARGAFAHEVVFFE